MLPVLARFLRSAPAKKVARILFVRADNEEWRCPGRTGWYVSYTVKSDRAPRRYARRTKTFDTEEHARLFVREIAVSNQLITAGTINPHSPKRVIPATEVAAWAETPVQFSGDCPANE
jgi:hypothetical protein